MHVWKKRRILNKLSKDISYISKVYENDFDIEPQDVDADFLIKRRENKKDIMYHFSKIIEKILLEK